MGKLPVRKYKKGANRVSIIPISAFAVHYSFLIDKNKDYVTLVTCTPYGVNTHRLLIRGIRTEYVEPEEKAEETPIQQIAKVDPVKIMIIGLVAMVIMIIIVYIVIRRKNRKTEESSRKDE